MAEGNRNTKTGTAGGADINVDLRPLDHAAPKKVQLSANYTLAYPPGYPTPPDLTGCAASNLYFPRTITSGTTIALVKAEADALIAAGKATAV
jgi:hypothetical protein